MKRFKKFAGQAWLLQAHSMAARTGAANNQSKIATNGTTITVNNPPLSRPHHVNPKIAQSKAIFFTKLLGVNSELISTRAVAYKGESSGDFDCLLKHGEPNNFVASHSKYGGENGKSNCS